ncbi:GntR family transcriptional regulator, partial [Rhodopseudomonas palustris]
ETADLLRDMIVTGELAPGQKIPERQLCLRFGISRTPLREALKVLAAEGMVELLPQRGARVAVITPAELTELFPIIASIEALAGELACVHISDPQIAAIEDTHRAMVAAFERDEPIEYARLNHAIHMALFEAAQNRALLSLYKMLELRIRNIRHTVRQLPEDWRIAVDDHERMVRALRRRDAATLAKVMRQHVLNTAQAVRHALAFSEPADEATAAPSAATLA